MYLATRRSNVLLTSLILASVIFFLSFFVFDSPGNLVRYGRPGSSATSPQFPPRVPKPAAEKNDPIAENFPLAVKISSPSDLPPVPSWNTPPSRHPERGTPLFIGFTRNWPMLQQTVVSYITAGWPPSDIYVVENTGTMTSNKKNLLTLQNPFYIDYNRLTKGFGVNVLTTPTLLSFAQLQNFYLSYALEQEWDHYFWGHMDVVALSEEEWVDPETQKYKSLYQRVVDVMEETFAPSFGKWAIRFFAYDRLALVNVDAFMDVGGWDPMIGYYMTDCDMHERLFMKDYSALEARVGLIYDVGSSLDDLMILYRRQPKESSEKDSSSWTSTWGEEDARGSENFANLTRTLDGMQRWKNENSRGRNFWQGQQQGGQGEPFYVDSRGFEDAIQMTIGNGRAIYSEKWGHRDCNLREVGLGSTDPWKMQHDW